MLEEHVALADQKYEEVMERVQELEQKPAALQREIPTFVLRSPRANTDRSGGDTRTVLTRMLRANPDARDVGAMARRSEWKGASWNIISSSSYVNWARSTERSFSRGGGTPSRASWSDFTDSTLAFPFPIRANADQV